jgi:O-antigen/teichoic acid export membrane protein
MAIALLVARPRLAGLVDWPVAWRALKLGVPLALSGLAGFVLNAGDRIIVQRELGAAEVGRYQVAYTVGYVVVLLLSFTSSAWTPRFAELRDPEHRWRLSTQSRDSLYRLLVPVILGITLGAPIALRIVAPPSYGQEGLLVVVFLVALSAFPVAASGASGRVLITARRGKTLALIAGTAAVLNVVLNLAFVPWMGIAGAALATVLSFTFLAAVQVRVLPDTPVWRRPPTRLVVEMATAIAVSAATVLLPQSSTWNLLRLAVAVACIPWLWTRLRTARHAPDEHQPPIPKAPPGRHRLVGRASDGPR